MVEDRRRPDMIWLLFSPSGRLSRRSYCLAILFWFAVNGVVISQMFASENHDGALALWTLGLIAVTLAWILSSLMLSVKRLHDVGLPGVWALLLALPVIGLITLCVLAIMPSDGPNAYGRASDTPGPNW